jgi:hypothetical protein
MWQSRHRLPQPFDERVDLGQGLGIAPFEVSGTVKPQVGDDLDRPRQVVEDEQPVDQHERPERESEALSGRLTYSRLKGADRFVREVADGAAGEPRQGPILAAPPL